MYRLYLNSANIWSSFRKGGPQGKAKCKGSDVEPVNGSRELCMPLTRKERKVKVD